MKRLFEATRPAAERCDLCALPIDAVHPHLYDVRARSVRCACRACALLAIATLRRIPDRRERVELDVAAWLARLGVPVKVAAIIAHDDGRATVGYPGPAGLVEASLDDDAWRALRAQLPALAPEVEAVVCSTLPGGGAWLVGIDVVFEMIAELRTAWHGVAGGPGVSDAAARVLARLGGT